MIERLLVANRGEIARRIVRTCRDLGIETVVVHSEPDTESPVVGEADYAVRLPGASPAETYLDTERIVAAARRAGADAIHPGYGFASESAAFARAVLAAGLVWIGPRPETIAAMGSKVEAKRRMADAGVPILDLDPDRITADDLPVLVKASAGGGGRGMRVVRDLADLSVDMADAAAEAASAFGDGTVFCEPYLPTARHVEVQVLADGHGTVWVVGDRDCSLQRRHQKVVEEAPAPGLSETVRATLHTAAEAACRAVDYLGAGTVEFLVVDAGADDGRVYFCEMNTRLQVEHPVTEAVTGLDLVAEQIAVAEGRPLEGAAPESVGHAVEVRLYAEDPADDWAPQTGRFRAFDLSADAVFRGPRDGVRTDAGVVAGTVVGPHYDALLAKVVAHGPDRHAALRRLSGALRTARIHGPGTNLALLRAILADPDVRAGRLHTTLLEERLDDWTSPAEPAGLRRAAIAAVLATARRTAESSPVLSGLPVAFRNVPSQPRRRTLAHGGEELTVAYRPHRDGIDLPDDPGIVVERVAADGVDLVADGVGVHYAVTVGPEWVDVDGPDGSISLRSLAELPDPERQVAAGSLLAAMPGTVVSIAVATNEKVAAGDVVVVLEAMKMQHTVTAPGPGRVEAVVVAEGDHVEAGAVLAVIEGDDHDD